MALQKEEPSARKIEKGHFLVRQVFLSQNKVISKSSFLINNQNLNFSLKIIVISKKYKTVFTFN